MVQITANLNEIITQILDEFPKAVVIINPAKGKLFVKTQKKRTFMYRIESKSPNSITGSGTHSEEMKNGAELLTIPQVAEILTVSVRKFYYCQEYFEKMGLKKVLIGPHGTRYKKSSIQTLLSNLSKQNGKNRGISNFKARITEHIYENKK